MSNKFGVSGQPIVGRMGFCAQCRNKAEVSVYPGGNPQAICGDCYQEDMKLEEIISERNGATQGGPMLAPHVIAAAPVQVSERDRYINCIQSKASPEWLEGFINEVIIKNVLKFDWKEIIQNQRWFSILDLRRFALQVDPAVDDPPKQESLKDVSQKPKPKRRKGAKHV